MALPQWSAIRRTDGMVDFAAVKEHEIAGIQVHEYDPDIANAGLCMSGMARLLDPQNIEDVARHHRDCGFVATTLHLGTGFESDCEMDAYADAVVAASEKLKYRLFVETHRATITQDPWRTLNMLSRHPDLNLNADLSHWYTGQEMRYGCWDSKIAALVPVFQRTRFMHGRIGNSCVMQMPLIQVKGTPAWSDYHEMWSLCVSGFLNNARSDETLIFAPELLPAEVEYKGQMHQINYALRAERQGDMEELSDRWLEALELINLIKGIWAQECTALDVETRN